MAVNARVNLNVNAVETGTTGLGLTKIVPHLLDFSAEYATGTSASQQDVAYSVTLALTAAAQTIDLRGVTGAFGSALTLAEVTGVIIKNKATTTGYNLTVGAGSNPWITWLIATGDGVVVGPGGLFMLTSPVDGYATVAGTGDILTFDPGANSFSVDVVVLGRSA